MSAFLVVTSGITCSLAIASGARGNDGHGGGKGDASCDRNGKSVGVYRTMSDPDGALFGTKGESAERRAQFARKQSSPDALIGDAKKLTQQVRATDRDRVDEYFTTIRTIEKRLSKTQEWADRPYPNPPLPQPNEVGGRNEIELAPDLMHIELQSDSTRVMTYMFSTAGIQLAQTPCSMTWQLDDEKPCPADNFS